MIRADHRVSLHTAGQPRGQSKVGAVGSVYHQRHRAVQTRNIALVCRRGHHHRCHLRVGSQCLIQRRLGHTGIKTGSRVKCSLYIVHLQSVQKAGIVYRLVAVAGNENFVSRLAQGGYGRQNAAGRTVNREKRRPRTIQRCQIRLQPGQHPGGGVQVIVAVYFRNINFRTRQAKIRVALVSGHMERIAL